MVLTALRGAVGFLTRVPVGTDERAWEAFGRRVYVMPLVGYPVGLLVGLALVVPLPAPTVAVLYVLAVFAVTGVNHADGLADLGDAAAVHGDPETRRSAMRDTAVGVGAVLAVGVGLLGLALAGLLLASLPGRVAVAVAVAAEVGAKLSMATLAAVGRPSHRGLGSQLLGASHREFVPAVAVAAPAALLAWPSAAAAPAVAAGPVVAVAVLAWARPALGGVSGDVFGAGNELARVVGLHAGVVAWTLW